MLFDEILFDYSILLTETSGDGSPITGSPEFANTTIKSPTTGIHKTNVNRYDAIETLNAEVVLTSDEKVRYFLNMWRGGYGSAVGLRLRVPYDYIAEDEVFGTGDGVTNAFQLKVAYTRPGVTARQDVRKIVKPVMDTPARLTNLGGAGGSVRLYEPNGVDPRVISNPFVIKYNGVGFTSYTVNNTTGLVTFSSPPANGAILSWSGEFDIPAAFVGNAFTLRKFAGSGKAQGISFREILPSELGL